MLRKTSIGYHTIALFLKRTWEQTDALMKCFKDYSQKAKDIKIYEDDKVKGIYHIEFIGEDRGVRWVLYYNNSSKKFRYYGIEVIINPKILSGEKDYIVAANETHLPKAAAEYNALVKGMSDKLPLFADYKIKRIDYCINFDICELGINCDLDLLIALIQRGNIPFNFKEPYNITSGRRRSGDNSFYLKSGNVTINCYSKYAEWLANHPDRNGIEEAYFVVRFEVQCNRSKILYMLDKKTRFMTDYEKYTFSPLKYLLSDDVAYRMVWDYFSQVLMLGDYYKLDEAVSKVEKMPFRHPKSNRLINTLKFIANHQGIDNARRHLVKLGDEKELQKFNWSLPELAGMGINPVTIPRREKIKRIPGLLECYKKKADAIYSQWK